MPAENYSYDGVGNRTASHLSASYGYQPFNKLTSTATATYIYDNNGNLTSKTDGSGTTTFTFNEENQLTQVALPSGLTVNYKYDGLGRRIQRTTTAGANERYVYDGADALIDLNADWSVATTYLNDLETDGHLRQTSASTGIAYYLSDHLSSTSGFTDAGGSLLETQSYDSFGNGSGSPTSRYGYTGRELDDATGLLYYRARWYDPSQGRFISDDPIGFEGGVNLYSYVENNPVDSNDPDGLKPLPRSRTRVRECTAAEMSVCVRTCGPKGVQSCRVSQTFRVVRWRDGKSLLKWTDGPLSCSCNDCEDQKLPVPVRRRASQPTMDEYRMQIEPARHMQQFWKVIIVGSAAGGAVVVGGPAAGGFILRILSSGGGYILIRYAQ
jgi:RHS repeat-associated protein